MLGRDSFCKVAMHFEKSLLYIIRYADGRGSPTIKKWEKGGKYVKT
jgi:hypothetical protein